MFAAVPFLCLCVLLAILVNRWERRGGWLREPRYYLVFDEYADTASLLSALETGTTKSAVALQYAQVLKTDRSEIGYSLVNAGPQDVIYVLNTGNVYQYDRHQGLVLSKMIPQAHQLSVNSDFDCIMACFHGKWRVAESPKLNEGLLDRLQHSSFSTI